MIDFENVLDELQKRVATGRAEGKYPVGLEEQLDAEFKAILDVVHRGTQDLEQLDLKLKSLHDALQARPNRGKLSFLRRGSDNSAAVLQLQAEILQIQSRILHQLRNDDLESVTQMVQLIKDRLFMIDPLAEAVVNLETLVLQDKDE